MSIVRFTRALSIVSTLAVVTTSAFAQSSVTDAELKNLNPGNFKQWLLPEHPPYPSDNPSTPERIELGKKLFFDPRLSRDGNMSCASCHNPMFGWSDGLGTGRGFQSMKLGRASPTVINTAYNTTQMWDGRKKDLEDQAMGPLEAAPEMNTDIDNFFNWMKSNVEYNALFAKAYPNDPVGPEPLRKAIATFERTVISRTSPFDKWIMGDKKAMTQQQLRGMVLFMDKNKANCAACHSAPNFTDNGFHNVGLASFGDANPDVGRYAHKPVPAMKGAFKTPTLRDIDRTAPYFHDGSAKSLMEVVEHYNKGGVVTTNLSTNIKPLTLTAQDKDDLIAFMKALSSPEVPFALPVLPK